jgi:replicative DNA helicase
MLLTGVSAANIDHLAELVVEKWKRRELGRLGTLAEELQYKSHEEVPIDEALKQLQDGLANLQQEGSLAEKGVTHIAESLIGLHDYIEKVSKGEVLPGIPSGFYDLDSMMSGGFNPGDLIIVAGRPAMGKSAFATQVGFNIASKYKLPVILFSLEMSKFQITLRSLASEAGIESGYLKTGRISDGQWEAVNRGIATLTEMPFYLDDNPVPDGNYIEAQCRRVMASLSSSQLGLIIVDYLQLMDGEGNGNRNNEISKLTRQLKRLAMKLNTPVMCLSQLSRGVESRTNKRPMLSDLRDSGAIEQDADKAIMLYREEYYTPDTTEKGIAEVIVAKNRDGATGTAKLLFDAPFTRFKNLAKPANGGW